MKWGWLGAAILAGVAGNTVAQTQWTDFPPAQSLLRFDPPGLSATPTRAFEGINTAATKRTTRNFGYMFNKIGGDQAFAHIYVWTVAADATFFVEAPNFDGRLPAFYPEFKGQTVSWVDAERVKSPSPIGLTDTRRFSALGKSCFAFGGLYGKSSSLPFAAAVSAVSGTEQIMGYYCAAKGHVLSEAHVREAMSRLSFDGLGKASGPGLHRFSDASGVNVAPARPAVAANSTRKVIVLWEGRAAPLSGSLTIESAQTSSRLEIRLPGYDKSCLGVSALDQRGAGSWAVECPDGTTGQGVFRRVGSSGGYVGEGTDNKGARITFSIDAAG